MSGASAAGGVIGSPLLKWQLALAVGAPVALGLGYMYYRNSSKSSSKSNRGKTKGNSKENGTSAADKQISIDADSPPKTDTNPETPLEKAQKFKIVGNEHFKIGKYDEAIAQYNKAIELCPAENKEALATFYQNRAAAYEQLKKYSSVIADCTKALELNPKYSKAYLRRARAMEHCNDLERALEDVTATCILETFLNQPALLMADRVLKQLGRQHAMEYLASKNFIMPSEHFINTYINTFHEDPVFQMIRNGDFSNLPVGFVKILQCIKEQNYDDIIPLCTNEINNSESDTLPYKMEMLLLRATFYLLLGQHNAALEDFGNIINSDTASKALKVNALIKRAGLFIQLEDPDKTFCDFNMAHELNPDCVDVYYHRGQVHLLVEKVEEARDDFMKAIELKPKFDVAHVQKCYTDFRYGILKRDMEPAVEAAKNFEKTFEMFPNCTEAYTLYAQMLLELCQFEKADTYFEKAIKRDPNNAMVYVRRGLLQLQWNGDIDKAIEYINKALELDEKCEYAYESLGTIEVQRGNLTEAIRLFEKALPLGRSAMELTHIFGLRDAAKTQLRINDRLGPDVMLNLQNLS